MLRALATDARALTLPLARGSEDHRPSSSSTASSSIGGRSAMIVSSSAGSSGRCPQCKQARADTCRPASSSSTPDLDEARHAECQPCGDRAAPVDDLREGVILDAQRLGQRALRASGTHAQEQQRGADVALLPARQVAHGSLLASASAEPVITVASAVASGQNVGPSPAVKITFTTQHRLCATHLASTSLTCAVGSLDATAAPNSALSSRTRSPRHGYTFILEGTPG